MKRLLSKKAAVCGIGVIFLVCFSLYICFDAFFGGNFRSMQDRIPTNQVNLIGLSEMRASGGVLTRFPDLKNRLRHITGPIIIVDAMSEYHGYIHGIPTSFFAYHKPPAIKHYIRRLLFTGSTEVLYDRVVSEEEEARKYGFHYKKINIGSRFIASDQDVDDLIAFFDRLPKDAWLHFHCSHGKGRTSMLHVMLDTFRNAPTVELADIVKRQHYLGSEDLFNTTVWKSGSYNKEMLEHRKEFIETFYVFICQRKAGKIQKWSEWCQQAQSF